MVGEDELATGMVGTALGFRARRIRVFVKSGEVRTGFNAVGLGSTRSG